MEIRNYIEGKDEKEKIGIGLRNRVEEWLILHGINASKVESEIVNGSKIFYIDVDGDVYLEDFNLDDIAKIPKYKKFRNVMGKFILANKK